MSKNKEAKEVKKDAAEQAASSIQVPVFEKKKEQPVIAIVLKNFVKTTSYGPHTYHCAMKRLSAGQIITSKQEIDELLSINAPIRRYVEYVD